MPMSSKFHTESTGEKIVKIGQYLAKIWTKYNSLVFFGPPCTVRLVNSSALQSENWQQTDSELTQTESSKHKLPVDFANLSQPTVRVRPYLVTRMQYNLSRISPAFVSRSINTRTFRRIHDVGYCRPR